MGTVQIIVLIVTILSMMGLYLWILNTQNEELKIGLVSILFMSAFSCLLIMTGVMMSLNKYRSEHPCPEYKAIEGPVYQIKP